MNENVWILIPAYNEQRSLSEVISGLRQFGYDNILVVNDGSTDETHQVAHLAGAEVLNLIVNRGQGAALRAGIEYLRETINPEVIVTFDADGQHQSQDISALVEPILNDEVDIVLGSRFLNKKARVPLFRKIILKCGIVFTYIMSHVWLTDVHNGFRALSRTAAHSIEIQHRGMEHASDIIDEIFLKKLRYTERPVDILYTDYSLQKGQKNLNFVKIGLRLIFKRIF